MRQLGSIATPRGRGRPQASLPDPRPTPNVAPAPQPHPHPFPVCKSGYGYSQRRVKGPNGTTIFRNKYGCSKCPTNSEYTGGSDTTRGPYFVSGQGQARPKGTLNL